MQDNVEFIDRNAEVKAYCKALFVTALWVGGIIAIRTAITSGFDKVLDSTK